MDLEEYIKENWSEERLNGYSYFSGWHQDILDIVAEVWHTVRYMENISTEVFVSCKATDKLENISTDNTPMHSYPDKIADLHATINNPAETTLADKDAAFARLTETYMACQRDKAELMNELAAIRYALSVCDEGGDILVALAEKEKELNVYAKMVKNQSDFALELETKMAEYKGKLFLVLKTLEVENIEELMEKPSPYLVKVALVIFEAAKRYVEAESRLEELREMHRIAWTNEKELMGKLEELRRKVREWKEAEDDYIVMGNFDQIRYARKQRAESALRAAVKPEEEKRKEVIRT